MNRFVPRLVFASTFAAAVGCGDSTAPAATGPDEPNTGGVGTESATDDPPTSTTDDPTEGASSTDTGEAVCFEDPDPTLEGEAVPLSAFEFRSAFDPSDPVVYDPDDAAGLPGPVMVDAWGDRTMGAHGTVGVFPPGFVAPLHTHTHDYYGVVLRGQVTNPFGTDLDVFLDDDATNDAGEVVLDAGSFWYVPAGSQHTTTCVGPEVCWFYFHAGDLFDFSPIVDDAGMLLPGVSLEAPDPNAVLLPESDLVFAGEPGSFVQFAAAWGSMADAAHGTFGLFDAGAVSPVHVHGEDYYGVVISGSLENPFNLDPTPPALTRGGYWSVPANGAHVTQCSDDAECLFYFHAKGGFDFVPVCEQE